MRKVWKRALTASTAAALFMGLAIIAAPADAADTAGSSVSDPNISVSDVTIKYEEQYLTVENVTGNGSEQEIGCVVQSGKLKDNVADTKWEWYTADSSGKVRIDLSNLSTTKENYIQLKRGSDSADVKPMTIVIPATEKRLKVKYVISSGKAKLEIDGKDFDGTKGVYQYRTQYGDWRDSQGKANDLADIVSGSVMESYQVRGTKLIVRKMAVSKTLTEKDGQWEGGTFPGKEAKVSIKKQANGSKISVNYVKGTATLPKNSEWRIDYDRDDKGFEKDWEKLSDKKVMYIANVAVSGGGTIEIRKAADDKKLASKITRLKYDKVIQLENVVSGSPITVSGSQILKADTIKDSNGNVVAAGQGATDDRNNKFLQITNKLADEKIDVYFGSDDPNGKIDKNEKISVKSIKGNTMSKYKSTDYEKGVWIRKQGKKASKNDPTSTNIWATRFVKWE